MATESQVKANHKNSQKSTGPRTAEGKEASSQNALKHGLCANKTVIKTENREEFENFRDNMLMDLSPQDAMEEMLAERIVSLSWRLKRAEHFQNTVIDALIEHGLHEYVSNWHSDSSRRARQEAEETGNLDIILGIVINKDFANTKTLEQLFVYERRIESCLYRAIAELKKLKRMRREQIENVTCTNEAKLEETCDSGLAARDLSSDGEGWQPQAALGDGLETENGTNKNEANLENKSTESHPHPEKSIQDEDATHGGFQPEIENTKSEIQNNKESKEINPENSDCTNEAKSPTCGGKT